MAETRIDELRRRVERDPGSRLFAQLAEEHRKAGEHAEAIRVARAGLALHPAYPSARLTLGRALLDTGDAAGARAELAQVLREAPDNILASRFLGQALEMTGDLAGALKQYAATLKMAPGDRQLEAQVAALRLRAQSGGTVAPEVTAPMRPVAPPPLPARATPRPPAVAAPPGPARPTPLPARPPVPPPPPTERMVLPAASGERAPDRGPEGPSPSEPTILLRPAAAPPPHPEAAHHARALGGRLAEAPASTSRPVIPAPTPHETEEESPTLPKVAVPDLSAFASTLPPTEKAAAPPAAAPPPPVGDESFEETLESPAARAEAGPLAAAPRSPGPADTVDGGPADTVDQRMPMPVTAVDGPPAAAAGALTAPDLAAETLSPEKPAPRGAPPAPAPLSSSTLAELYLRQGLTERAREVYRQVLADDPGNERARAGLRDLDGAIALGGPDAERVARRAALQRTIAALETMLAAVRRA